MMNVESKIISREISPLLWKAGETVCTAESCTSGQISAAITSVPGSSTYFKGGIVCYTNEIKTRFLGVSQELLEEKGAVSEEVVRAMFEGALKAMENHIRNSHYRLCRSRRRRRSTGRYDLDCRRRQE